MRARRAQLAASRRRQPTRLLYRITLAIAAGLGLLVALAPLLPTHRGEDLGALVGYLFAYDATLRKAAVISALGLWVTAVVFFRTPHHLPVSRDA